MSLTLVLAFRHEPENLEQRIQNKNYEQFVSFIALHYLAPTYEFLSGPFVVCIKMKLQRLVPQSPYEWLTELADNLARYDAGGDE